MDSAESWRSLFDSWPEQIDRRGAVLSKQGESLWFDNFLVSANILLLERNAPDASGARKAFIGYESIAMIKLPTTADLKELQAMGFRKARGSQAPAAKPES